MWLQTECEGCEVETADIQCDGCGTKVCVLCSTLLEDVIEDAKGNRYEHLCMKCVGNISVDGHTYVGCKLVILNGGKHDMA
jgi:hypothetical protein